MNWILTDAESLPDTAFFELLPGPYRDKCWNSNSLFLDEERFGYIEPIVERHVPGYDHYAFVEADRAALRGILDDFEALQVFIASNPPPGKLRFRIGFVFRDSEARFTADLEQNLECLRDMIAELSSWLRIQLSKHEVVSILGL